ncbi:hypothetical protein TNCV_3629081 [Trichonephila clavipes]|nr:hypothetical protein TNCV_3629081 [Trichonephila clavipes]
MNSITYPPRIAHSISLGNITWHRLPGVPASKSPSKSLPKLVGNSFHFDNRLPLGEKFMGRMESRSIGDPMNIWDLIKRSKNELISSSRDILVSFFHSFLDPE